MYGNVMQMPLLISALLRHADSYHGDTEIVSRLAPREMHRHTYRDAHRRTRQLANALGSLGVEQSSRVGTLTWNTHRHFELYFAVSGMGSRACPTPRLESFPSSPCGSSSRIIDGRRRRGGPRA